MSKNKSQRISKLLASLGLSALVVSGLVAVVPAAATSSACAAASSYAAGDGTVGTPYQIATPQQLQYMTNQLNANVDTTSKFFEVTANLDFAQCDFNPSAGGFPFKGSFDGGNFTISNYRVAEGDSYSGIFGQTQGAVLKDIVISGATIIGSVYTGALVGLASNRDATPGVNPTILQNITVINSQITGESIVGGVAGGAFNGSGSSLVSLQVINSTISAEDQVGGVIGRISHYPSADKVGFFGGEIVRIATGTTENWYGGLFGLIEHNFALTKSAFRGSLSLGAGESRFIGALIGSTSNRTVSITDSYARGEAEVLAGNIVAGMIGESSGSVTLSRGVVRVSVVESGTNNEVAAYPFTVGASSLTTMFYDDEIHTSWSSTPAGAGKTTAQMENSTNFTPLSGWGFGSKNSIEAGTDAATWYWDDSLEGKLFLVWEYLNKTITACEVGRYSFNAIGPCSPVPAGSFGAFTGRVSYELCPVGTFQAAAGATECDLAPAGRFVQLPGQTLSIACPAGTFQPQTGQMVCLNAQPGFFTGEAGSTEQTQCAAGTTSDAGATSCFAIEGSAPAYSGPMISSKIEGSFRPGSSATFSGSRLSGITSITIGGLSSVATCDETSCSFIVPLGLVAGTYDLSLSGSHGVLRIQDGIVVRDSIETAESVAAFTKRISDSQAKFYAKNIVGVGKVQFFLNGKEIAWVRAVDDSDLKLRTANGASYLVRTVTLVEGMKNVLEVYVDGERLRRVAYTY